MKINLIKIPLLIAISTISSNQCLSMSIDVATKTFIVKELDESKKYDIFLRGTINEKTIFETILQLIKQKKSNEDIVNQLIKESEIFKYKNTKPKVEVFRDALIDAKTGFIDAIKNQYEMFNILIQCIVSSPESEEKQTIPDNDIWVPMAPRIITITDQNILLAQQEFILELDFFISEFTKQQDLSFKPTWKSFKTWLCELDGWWIKEKFAEWVKTLKLVTKESNALETTVFQTNNIIFFIETYIPKTLIINYPKIANVDFDKLKKVFPGFKIYENSKLYNLKNASDTKKTIKFIVNIINSNLTTMLNNYKYPEKIAQFTTSI